MDLWALALVQHIGLEENEEVHYNFQSKYLISLKNLAKTAVVSKKYTKLIKYNLKMIVLIKNM